MVLRQGPTGALFLMSEVPLHLLAGGASPRFIEATRNAFLVEVLRAWAERSGVPEVGSFLRRIQGYLTHNSLSLYAPYPHEPSLCPLLSQLCKRRARNSPWYKIRGHLDH